jgi:DNA-binding CsgD family transcriptional regulator
MSDIDLAECLTPRQLEILALLDQGAPIKVIAARLEISPGRVNQLIRGMKDKLGVSAKFQLVQAYRGNGPGNDTYRNDLYPITALPVDTPAGNHGAGPVAGEFAFADIGGFDFEAPFAEAHEPAVVPGILNGIYAPGRRLIAMILLMAAIAAAIVLVLMAAMTVTQVWEGKGSVPLTDTGATA